MEIIGDAVLVFFAAAGILFLVRMLLGGRRPPFRPRSGGGTAPARGDGEPPAFSRAAERGENTERAEGGEERNGHEGHRL